MKKHTFLVTTLSIITAGMLASCGSSGSSDPYTPPKIPTYNFNHFTNPTTPTDSTSSTDPNPPANNSSTTNDQPSNDNSTDNVDDNDNDNDDNSQDNDDSSDTTPTTPPTPTTPFHKDQIASINSIYPQLNINPSLTSSYAISFGDINSLVQNEYTDKAIDFRHNIDNLYLIGATNRFNYGFRHWNTNDLVLNSFPDYPLNYDLSYIPTFLSIGVTYDIPESISYYPTWLTPVIKTYGHNNDEQDKDNSDKNYLQFYTTYISAGYKLNFLNNGLTINTKGLSPFTELYIANIKQNEDPYLSSEQLDSINDDLYKTFVTENKAIDVVNVAVGKQVTDPFIEKNNNLLRLSYDQLTSLMHAAINDKSSPLFILPTGRYDQNEFKEFLQKEYDKADNKNLFIEDLFKKDDPIYITLNEYSPLSKLTNDNDLNKNLIIVGGVDYDRPNSNKNRYYYLKEAWDIITQINPKYSFTDLVSYRSYNPSKSYGYNTFSDGVYALHTRDNDVNNKYISNTNGIPFHPVGAVGCGEAKLFCVSAPYAYQSPFVNVSDANYIVRGTEYASAYVSGVALLVKQKFPWMTAANLQDTILTTATDMGDPGIDDIYGWGIVNLNRALQGPAQFAFGDFDIDFHRDPNYVDTKVSSRDILNLFTTDPYINSFFYNSISHKLKLYDFTSVVGNGGLNLNNTGTFNNSGLRIIIAGYNGDTNITNSILVLENPLYSKKYYYRDQAIQFYNQSIYFKNSYNDHTAYMYNINLDQNNHPNAYANRKEYEKDKAPVYENKGLGGLLIFGRLWAQRTAEDDVYKYSNKYDTYSDNKIAQQHLSKSDYSFHSKVTINQDGILVSNLPEIDEVVNKAGYYLPYSFFTYGQFDSIHHTTPYAGSIVHKFTQEDGVLIVGVSLKAKHPYDSDSNDGDLSDLTVTTTDGKYNNINFYYYTQFDDGKTHTPFARKNRVVSTAVFADTAKVSGRAYIYFDYGSKIANATGLKTLDKVSFTIKNHYVPYLPSKGLYVSLVNAHNLTGKFNSIEFLDPSFNGKYSIIKQYTISNFVNDYYGKSLVVEIQPISSYDRASVSSGHSILDANLVVNSANNLFKLYNKADQQYFGNDDGQNYLALASAAQSSDNQNFRTFLYQNALTVYPDLQLATTQNSHSQVNNFIDRVANNYLHNVSHQVYFDYNYKQTNWTSPTSAIFGSDKVHNLSLGYYGQSYGLNYGLAGLVNYGTWNEDLTSLNADLAHLQLANLTNLASAKTITAGLVATIGKAQAHSFYAINLSANFHNYDLTRNLLFLTETTKFNALDFELAGRYGYSLYHTDHSRFSVIGGLSLVDNYRLAVKETASINPTKLEQVTGNTDAQAVAAQFKYTSLDAKAHNALNMYASVALAYTYNFKVLNFNQALSVQGKAERVLNDLNFNINSNTNGSSLASTSVFNNNYIITAKATYQVNFTTNLKLDLYAAYTFCQNWQDKTAGTSLTYSF